MTTPVRALLIALIAAVPAVGAAPAPPLPGPFTPGEAHPETSLRIAFAGLPAALPQRAPAVLPIRANAVARVRITVLARRPGFPIVRDWHANVRPGRNRIRWTTPVRGNYVVTIESLGRRVGAPLRISAPRRGR